MAALMLLTQGVMSAASTRMLTLSESATIEMLAADFVFGVSGAYSHRSAAHGHGHEHPNVEPLSDRSEPDDGDNSRGNMVGQKFLAVVCLLDGVLMMSDI